MKTLERFGVTNAKITTLHPTKFSSSINEDDILDMCDDLLRNRTVTSANFSYITLSAKAARAVGSVISLVGSASILTHLKLSKCGLNAESLEAFINGIGDHGCIPSLKVIDLSDNNIMDAGVELIAAYLTKYNRYDSSSGAAIQKGYHLTNIQGSTLSPLTPPPMRASQCNRRSIDDAGGSSYIHTIELAGCKIGVRGAAAIGAVIGGFMPPHMMQRKEGDLLEVGSNRLANLNLEKNKLKYAGVSHICQGLMTNQILRILNISSNSISAEGGNAIARMLKSNQSLKTLQVSDNYLSESMPAIACALAHRGLGTTCLDFRINRITPDTCAIMTKALNRSQFFVSCLLLDGNPIGDEGLVALFHAIKGTAVELLTISDISITGKSAPVLVDIVHCCEMLSSLHIDGNFIGDEGVAILVKMISESDSLEALNLRGCGLGQLSVRALAYCLKKLRKRFRYLTLSDNKNINILPVLDALCRCRLIRDLDLSDMDLGSKSSGAGDEESVSTEESVMDASDVTGAHIREDINGAYLRALVKVFGANSQLTVIRLAGNPVTEMIHSAVMTREFAESISDDVNYFEKLGTFGTCRNIISVTPAVVLSNREEHRQMVNRLFRPKWAANIMDQIFTSDEDSGGEEGSNVPLVPHADSLHHPLYPGYGNGRFSNECLVSSMSDPYSYTIANSTGVEPPTVIHSDSAAAFMHPMRRPLKSYPYSTNALEKNISRLPITEASLRAKFQSIDIDDCGSLDRKEFKKMYLDFEHFGVCPTETDVDAIIERYGIGLNDRVSFDQFSILMLKLAQM